MLKSTYKPSAQSAPLPSGWTEHKAPTGHLYYYNAVTQQSTYNRPSFDRKNPSISTSSPSNRHKNHAGYSYGYDTIHPVQGQQSRTQEFSVASGERPSHAHGLASSRHQPADRPKSKHIIPDCSPWLLIKTKLGRRFVHNPKTRESLWKFPLDVMKGVVEYDRNEREKKSKVDAGLKDKPNAQTLTESSDHSAKTLPVQGTTLTANAPPRDLDIDEYEEVEVTDDESADHDAKRQRIDGGTDSKDQPVEFHEDDIAYQLAAMGHDYGLDPGEYGDEQGELDEAAQGLQLTAEDSKALFFDLLDDFRISPYVTWEKIMGEGHIIEDDRYVTLPTMKARKEAWSEWSRDRVRRLKEIKENQAKQDPGTPYLAFLQEHASPKLFWPEFKRKYRKEPEMRDTKLSDKDREKWYREYISRLKLPESKLKADLVDLLKSLPLQILDRNVTLETLPPTVLKDLRYVSLRRSVRDPMITTFLESLPFAPKALDDADQEATDLQKQERQTRERALAERQKHIGEERRRIRGAMYYSREVLKEREEEIARARQFGRNGLMSHEEVGQEVDKIKHST